MHLFLPYTFLESTESERFNVNTQQSCYKSYEVLCVAVYGKLIFIFLLIVTAALTRT